MEDIAPQLIEAVTDTFRKAYDRSDVIRSLLEKVKKGTATYAEAQDYALEVSRLIGKAYEVHVSSAVLPEGRMFYNIASRLIPQTLDEDYRLVADYAADVQRRLNERAGIGLRAQVADKEPDRIDGLVELASGADRYDDVAAKILAAFDTFSQSVVDGAIRKNAELHYRSGLSPKIIRKAERKCCDWCRGLAGEYDYPEVPEDIYRRHERCRCTVLYDPADGSKSRQNVHSKEWTDRRKSDKLKVPDQSGAMTGAKKTPGWEQRHAERYYEEIRNRSPLVDANKIAANVSGFSARQIEDIRQHVFIRKQPRAGGMARFDADFDMAQAWQRLVDGKDIRASDRILLLHEYEELTIMAQTGCSYEEAHEKANEKYNWWKAFMEED